jgi:glutamate-1-semialdehyde 2,1-aminomutase
MTVTDEQQPARDTAKTIAYQPPVHAPKSQVMFERAQRTLALGASSNLRRNLTGFPLYFERAAGVYFYDVEGNRYLDYTLGFGPNILGSAHPAINAAVREQLERAYTFGASHPLEYEAAELIAACVPGVEHVMLSNTGSEAVQAALRLARATTGRDKILAFDGHYHGWLNNVRIRRHPRPSYAGEPIALFKDQPASEISEMLVIEWNDVTALEEMFALHGAKLAAVICEPVPTSGSCMPQPGFLQRVVELCSRYGAFSIFDEVVTGFRIALGGARRRWTPKRIRCAMGRPHQPRRDLQRQPHRPGGDQGDTARTHEARRVRTHGASWRADPRAPD